LPTDQQVEEYHTRSGAYLARGESYVSIADLSQLGLLTATQRRRQAEWLQTNAVALGERLLGSATILSSAPLRVALTLIMPFKTTPMPYSVVPDMDSAVRYVTRRLEEAGLGKEAERIRHQLALRAMKTLGPR
jgi:hypothetical protein